MSQEEARIMPLEEFKERVQEGVADVDSEEGQEEIGDNYTGHVTVMWQDGEINTTKGGDLFGKRTFHLTHPALMEGVELLWDVPEGKDNHKKVVTDPEVAEMVKSAEIDIEVAI